MSKTFWAWAAGFFDGEGCVTIPRDRRARNNFKTYYYLSVIITNTKRKPLELIKEKLGDGCVCMGNKGNDHQNISWIFIIRGNRAIKFLSLIQPYLQIKSEQVSIALKFQENLNLNRYNGHHRPRPPGFKGSLPLLKDDLKFRINCFKEITILNKRGK